ncbi:hypothetical protein HZA86_02300 [Candidatus Uhrbacteria bacterium]|nr:hypothetical protein [Candidatus Uhrbacteria bacterium]
MRLSTLQKSILLQCFDQKRLKKKALDDWYAHQAAPSRSVRYKDTQNTVTKTLENLIDKGCLTGVGIRTQQKWFVHEVRLTPDGRKIAKKLRGVQQALPLQPS